MITTSIFRKFSTLDQAKEIENVLKLKGIESILADNIAPVDVTFANNTLQNEYEIRIKVEEFEKAELVLEEYAETFLSEVEPDHYLFQFSDQELYEILAHADEWSDFDYKLSQKLLRDRGKNVDQEFLKKIKDERIQLLSKPEENQQPWIIAGYISAILGGAIGIIIGYVLWTYKKTLPNGQKVYSYKPEDRKHGKIIFYLSVIVFPVLLLIKVFWKQ